MDKGITLYELNDKQVLEIEKKKICGILETELDQLKNQEKSGYLIDFYRESCKRYCTK